MTDLNSCAFLMSLLWLLWLNLPVQSLAFFHFLQVGEPRGNHNLEAKEGFETEEVEQ